MVGNRAGGGRAASAIRSASANGARRDFFRDKCAAQSMLPMSASKFSPVIFPVIETGFARWRNWLAPSLWNVPSVAHGSEQNCGAGLWKHIGFSLQSSFRQVPEVRLVVDHPPCFVERAALVRNPFTRACDGRWRLHGTWRSRAGRTRSRSLACAGDPDGRVRCARYYACHRCGSSHGRGCGTARGANAQDRVPA